MTATHALQPWPAPAAAPWRFGRAVPQGLQWVLRRNCSMSPKQVLAIYFSLSALSLAIATAFWFLGATLVMPFAWLELIALGVAWVVYARHAADRETLTLRDGTLDVEHRCGTTVQQVRFRAAAVRVEPLHDDRSLIELSGQGRSVHVGRYLRPELRDPLARELRRALRAPQGIGI